MTHDEASELLGAYALDAIEPEEAVLVAAHVASCPRCTAELAEHREVAGLLGDLGGDAPPELWASIASQASRPAPGPGLTRRHAPARQRRGPSRAHRALRAGTSALAVLGLVAVVALALQVGRLDGRVGSLTAISQERGLTEAAQAALLDPAATRVSLDSTGPARQRLAELVVVPSGRSFLVDSTLAALPSSRTYQLWAITTGRPVSLGLLGPDPTVVPFVSPPASRATTYAITVEPAGGSRAPTRAAVAQQA